jgi:hypothetical protein
MPVTLVAKWIRVCLLGAALVLQPVAGALAPAAFGTVAGALVASSDADAKGRSSGGYSRPSASRSSPSSSRTPSAGSSSGGYARPSSSSSAAAPSSAGDRALSRQGSAGALDSYRRQQDTQRTPSAGSGSWGSGGSRSPSASSSSGYRYSLPPARANYYGGRGWSPSPYMYSAPRSFGMWDAMFMWFMLDTLTRPSHAAFFHNNQNDPGYQQWRAEADRLAKDNAELKTKLDQLDRQLVENQGQPREPGKIPDDVPKDVVQAQAADDEGSGFGFLWWIVVIGGVVVFVWLWRARRRLDAPAAAAPATAAKETQSVPLFGTLGNYVDRKLSGKPYDPALFRVGMTVTIDPAPFLLAGDRIKAKPPGDTGLVSVESVGTIRSGQATVYRLHLGDDRFLQIHLDKNGQPDECRYYHVIDEVTPADAGEWEAWLDKDEGMIGWSEFQTKDGTVYARHWSPGLARVEPYVLEETLATVRGTGKAVSRAMLYSRALDAPPPAPAAEYVLVSAVERDGEAWVQIAAGIDVNPASLSLA